MFNSKRLKELENKLGLVYDHQSDYRGYEDLKYGDLRSIEDRLKRLEEKQGIDKYGEPIKK